VSVSLLVLALGVGLVAFGFQLWIPSNLQRAGFSETAASTLLRNAAVMGFPLNALVAWLYNAWSSKRTLVLLVALTAVSLISFAAAGEGAMQNRALLYSLLIMQIWGISTVHAVLSSYAAELFPTQVRSRGSGLIAGFSKAGGVLIIASVAIGLAPPSIAGTATIGAVPLVLAATAAAVFGIDTRQRRLEEITAEQLGRV
jgi:putative MFS transporter